MLILLNILTLAPALQTLPQPGRHLEADTITP
ncbi:hypothetical protein PSEUDO8O_170429 [Pseudomonas sp. 8O]|nr:hypothetical protein PSEUDO8O_170429 [Pseudomonas sp. 8O]